uniref:GON-4-like protein n=1 Tax=Cacopsylla melanoneura TaxID=428564 RepID=A0A8D8TDN2_9HEMI
MTKVHQQPIVGQISTDSPSTQKRTNLKFKRKKQVDAIEENPKSAENQRGNRRKPVTRPQRQRKISVSRSSQLILERKRKNSIRMNKNGNKSENKKDTSKNGSESGIKDDGNTDSVANNNDSEGSKQEGSIKVKERMELRMKYLGRKCKRKYKSSTNEDKVGTPKRKKFDDNIPIKKLTTKGKLDKVGKSTKKIYTQAKSISKSVKPGEKKPKHNLNGPNLSTDDQLKGTTKETALTGAKPTQVQTSSKPSPNPLETEFNLKLKADAETPDKEFSKLKPNQFKDKEVSKPSPNQHKTDKELGKPSPNMKAETLLDKEFSEDSSDDEEYRPNEEELNKLDDTLGDKSVTEEIADEDGIEDVTVEDVGGMTGQDKDSAGAAGPYMTRSKISYTDKALEDIEQAFIPPDIDLDMYDSVIDDQDWKEFLTEFTKPIDRISTNEDYDDTEFIPNLQEEEQIDSEEFRRDPGVKVSKKELNELMGELFDFTEIYDGDGNDEENIDANINDYVNLKFNETIQDGSYVAQKTKDTPKKVAFADQSNVNETKQNAHRKSVESNVNGIKQSTPKKSVESSGKGKRKSTPDKNSRLKHNLSEDVNKQIMDEINKEINKYIQINETYVYKGDTGGDTTENYDNYEEYIVIIGNNEPSTEEINKLAQVKMAEKDDLMKNKTMGSNEDNAVENPVNNTDQAILEHEASPKEKPSQELSIQLVQKTRIPAAKSNKKEKPPVIKKPPKPKPVKEKSELVHDINYNYGKITQKQYKEIYEAYVKAIKMYKVNYGITNENELSYHSNISEYGASLYRKHYQGTLDKSAPDRDKENIDNDENVQRHMEPVKHPTIETIHLTNESTNTRLNSSFKNAKTDIITDTTNAVCKKTKTNEDLSAKFKTCDIQDVSERNPSNDHVGQPIERETTHPTVQTLGNGDEIRNLHLFEEEDLKILQQQINQHIQYSLQHYLQTYNHPRLSGEASQAKQMIQTFHTTSRLKPANSFFNSLNIEAAMNLVNTWEQFHTSSVYKKHIDEEWNKCVAEWRHHTNILALPKPLTNIILNSKAFIYPLLLPAKSFEPKPRKLVNSLETNCELNLVVLGFINFAHIVQQETKYERFKLIHDVIVAIQQNYLPAHSVKHLAKKLYDLIKSPRSNLVQEFFRHGKVEEIRHFIVDYNEENMVAPRQQHLKLLPLAWQDWVRQNR